MLVEWTKDAVSSERDRQHHPILKGAASNCGNGSKAPNPKLISDRLLKRRERKPLTSTTAL
jgi:hypothetical protein